MRRPLLLDSVVPVLVLIVALGQSATAQIDLTAKKTSVSSAVRRLKLPLEFQGGCLAACCRYGPWRATEQTVAHTTRKASSGDAFTIQPNEMVTGLDGVLSTTKPGVVVLARPITLKAYKNARQVTVTLAAQDTVFTVELGAEGTIAYWWHRGTTYHTSNELAIYYVHGASGNTPYDVLSLPTQEWWAQVRNARGATGWVLDPRSFSGISGC